MVRAANDASSAYDKLQAKIKAVKEAQAVADERTTMQNLRIYGKEEAPAIGGNLQNRTSIEGFLKSAGLSTEQAMEETRKLFAKAGNSTGGVNWNRLNGFQEGQVLTSSDLAKYKSPSVYLAELAEKIRYSRSGSTGKLPDSALQAVSNLNAQKSYDVSSSVSRKTIDVNLRLGGTSVPVQVAENQEASLMALLQQLQDSKAIAGY